MLSRISKRLHFISEFSIPLILGVLAALYTANTQGGESYKALVDSDLVAGAFTIFGHTVSLHFLVNDILMVFFFGLAAAEIVHAVQPKGPLNPIRKALNPLLGTIGGVLGPISVYFLACDMMQVQSEIYKGWAIPTATDIALAWLVARLIFGAGHPAVAFLLLLAIADDAISLGIIAVFYPDAAYPVEPMGLLLVLAGVVVAFLLRALKVDNFWLYILFAGVPSWLGFIFAHLHPALALVPIVPFLRVASRESDAPSDTKKSSLPPLRAFMNVFTTPIAYGLFLFGFANAGVNFSQTDELTFIVFLSLFLGKIIGITGVSYLAHLFDFKLPTGMGVSSLLIVSMVAGIGLTVSLFVAGEAFVSPGLIASAKMGALFSVFIALPAFICARLIGIHRRS